MSWFVHTQQLLSDFFYIYLLVWMPMSLLKCKSIVYGALLQNYTKVSRKKLFLQNRFFGMYIEVDIGRPYYVK